MANQQLADYIKGQMMANISEADIKKILKDAGWPDAEVEENFKGVKSLAIQPAVAQPTASPVGAASSITGATSISASASKPVDPVKTEPKKESISFDFMTSPGSASLSSAAGPAKGKEKDLKDAKPLSMSADPAPTGSKPSMLPWIVAGVAVVAMIGVSVYFYMQSGSVSGQVDLLTASNAALTSQIADLKSNTAPSDELAAAKADALEANTELGLFAVPLVATGTPAAVRFDLKGTLGTAKSLYTLTTAKGIILSIKNSKDAKVDVALKPLVGTAVGLSGTHIPGTFDLVVENLNGSAIPEIIFATSTPPGATSTKP